MKHAYLIIAHNDFSLLQKLISLLDDSRNDIYVHIDKKTKNFSPDCFKVNNAKLHFIKKRIDAHWGHISLVEVELLLFETAREKGSYRYYHLLSGVDLPIKSQDYIHSFFEQNQGKEFIGYWQNRDKEAEWCVKRYHFFMKYSKGYNRYLQIITAKLRRLITKKWFDFFGVRNFPMQCKKGFQWVSITDDFCSYLLSRKKWIKKHFLYTFCPDETYKHTILWNSSFKNKIYSLESPEKGSMRKIDWKRGQMIAPYVWKADDFEELMHSDKLFARKFNSSVDKEIIDMIYRSLR